MPTKLLKIRPSDLKNIPVIVQALDYCWVPMSFIKKNHLGARRIIDSPEQAYAKEKIREWRRALVYGEQIVVPLGYFLHSLIINDYNSDYNRTSFQKLLSDKTIIPYLSDETNLVPSGIQASLVDDNVRKRWLDIIGNIEVSCIRFSWRSQKKIFQELKNTFSRRILSLHTQMDSARRLLYSNFDESRMIEFEMQLFALSSFSYQLSQEGKDVSRSELYSKFIDAPNSHPAFLHFDAKRPFVSELKQLIDRIYHNNFADAVGAYLLVPIDDSELFFLHDRNFDDNHHKTAPQPKRPNSFQRKAFAVVSPLLNTYNLYDLTLENIFEIRDSNEWHTYLQKFHDYLSDFANYYQHLSELKIRIKELNSRINKVFLDG